MSNPFVTITFINRIFCHVLEKTRKEVVSKGSGGMEVILSSLEVPSLRTDNFTLP